MIFITVRYFVCTISIIQGDTMRKFSICFFTILAFVFFSCSAFANEPQQSQGIYVSSGVW